MTNWLTGIGYMLSIVGVALLAWVAWPAVGKNSALIWAIVIGVILSVIGMGLRFAGHILTTRRIEEESKS